MFDLAFCRVRVYSSRSKGPRGLGPNEPSRRGRFAACAIHLMFGHAARGRQFLSAPQMTSGTGSFPLNRKQEFGASVRSRSKEESTKTCKYRRMSFLIGRRPRSSSEDCGPVRVTVARESTPLPPIQICPDPVEGVELYVKHEASLHPAPQSTGLCHRYCAPA